MKLPTTPKKHQKHVDLDKVVIAVSKTRLDHVEVEAFTHFAKAVWYDTDHVKSHLERRLNQESLPLIRKRRLLYLVDRLRRFPCLTNQAAMALKSFIDCWSGLGNATTPSHRKVVAAQKNSDKLAAMWGLSEDASSLLSHVLEFQTRHYVDEHHLPSGYSEMQSCQSSPKT